MIPYSELTEEQKDQDRIWADKSLAHLHSQDVAIKVDRELPDLSVGEHDYDYVAGYKEASYEMVNAGYVAVEPLIEEGCDHCWEIDSIVIDTNPQIHHRSCALCREVQSDIAGTWETKR